MRKHGRCCTARQAGRSGVARCGRGDRGGRARRRLARGRLVARVSRSAARFVDRRVARRQPFTRRRAGPRARGAVARAHRARRGAAAVERQPVADAPALAGQRLLRPGPARERRHVEQHGHAEPVVPPRSVGQGQAQRRARARRGARPRGRRACRAARARGERRARVRRFREELRAPRHRARDLRAPERARRTGAQAPARGHRHATRGEPGRGAAARLFAADRLV
ncbi:Uncharacterised protein [Burkholderia pseudomallei]|nr:Uncharacterised protein [Burkholderia pseudomallei]CAJ4487381.1 Uncharacterised protein [Burkholderia pseudomallei]VBC47315.1 Uncharacterised protein [Burkholderia pseudomallei]VBK15619.1 Uncharacterised protein [Burkholderia pseudomallei]VBM35665.1 Uncharacterised protein [Burkholderia pseudomallei]